ncbi:MAG: outer membrane lipoprotein carrier protein LolA [Bacteroidia bacterium]
MSKFNVLPFLILGIACFSFVTPNKEKDKVATKLLKEVSKKYKSYKTLKADFSVTSEAADAKTPKKTDKGTLYTKGNSFKLIFGGQEIFCDGKYIWTYSKEINECVKDNYDPNSSNSMNPSKIFTVWEKGFLYTSDGSYKKGNTEISKIKLTPTDKTKPYFLMNLEVNNAAKTVQSMKISFKGGNKQLYYVNSQTPNVSLSSTFFTFNASNYPGVEVIDLSKK